MDIEELLNLNSLSESLNTLLPGQGVSLKDIVFSLLKGDLSKAASLIWEATIGALFHDISVYKNVLLSILLLAVISAVFARFGDLFKSKQISEISYYIVYLMLAMILVKIFTFALDIGYALLNDLVAFIKLLVPTYLFTVGLSSGSLTAIGFYKIMLCIIYLVEYFLRYCVVPFIYSYIVLSLVNGLMEQDRLSQLLELMKKGIEYVLKISLTLITGVGVIQAMISPSVDHVKTSVLHKVLSAIPGIGNIAEGTAQTIYGSAVIIKNSIGTALVLILIIVLAGPVIKLFLLTVVIKLAGAFMGLISDKRVTLCTSRVGDGTFLLCKTLLTGAALFVITIAIVAVSTNRGF